MCGKVIPFLPSALYPRSQSSVIPVPWQNSARLSTKRIQYFFNQWLVFGAFLPTVRFGNQGIGVEVALVTNKTLDECLLAVPTILASLDLEILCPRKGCFYWGTWLWFHELETETQPWLFWIPYTTKSTDGQRGNSVIICSWSHWGCYYTMRAKRFLKEQVPYHQGTVAIQ